MSEPEFTLHVERPRPLLIGEGAGIGAAVALVERLREQTDTEWRPLVLLGSSDAPFPFRARPSQIVVKGVPDDCIACMPLLDGWGIASRLASREELPGCFEGTVVQLAEQWLLALHANVLREIEIFAAGPVDMLEAAGEVAWRCGVPWQAKAAA